MAVRAERSWSVWCDWPGCGHQFESGDYSVFGEGWEPSEIVTDNDGWLGRDGRTHYCGMHPMTWASDHEDGEPFPEPPYLLIHDGDTINPLNDDGKVTYVDGREGERPRYPHLQGPV